MKRFAFALVALLFLCGCGAGTSPTAAPFVADALTSQQPQAEPVTCTFAIQIHVTEPPAAMASITLSFHLDDPPQPPAPAHPFIEESAASERVVQP